MLNQAYQKIIRGESSKLAVEQVPQFVDYCEEKELPNKFCEIAVGLYRQNPEVARLFVERIVSEVLTSEKYNAPHCNQAKATLYNYHSAFVLGAAIRGKQNQTFGKDVKDPIVKAEDTDKSNFFNRAMVHLYSGNLEDCLKLAKKMEDEYAHKQGMNHMLTVTQFMLAQCYFAKRAYDKALECLRQCLIRNRCLPINARMAMAYCYFNLNKFEMAKVCAERVLQLEPKSADAFLCLAIVYERAEDYTRYFQNLKCAYDCDKNNFLTLYLVAEHLILRNEVQKAEEVCLRGLDSLGTFARILRTKEGVRNDYTELYCRFVNLQGQIAHKRKNYTQAIQYYSSVAEKGLFWNDISLVQCLIAVQNYKEAMLRMDYTYKIYEREKRDMRLLKDTYRIMAYLRKKCKSCYDPARDAIFYYNEAIKFDKSDTSLKEQLCYLLTSIQFDSHKALRIMQDLEKQLKTSGVQLQPQTLINMGVLLMENHQPEQAQLKLKKAIEVIEKWDDLQLAQQHGFLIIAKYNYAICLEKGNYNHKALDLLQDILTSNPFHINSLLKKALILHKIGDIHTALQSLTDAQSFFRQRLTAFNDIDKLRIMKAYILLLQEKYQDALEVMNSLQVVTKSSLYCRVLQFSINYGLIANSVHCEMQPFLQGKREEFEKACSKNNRELFCCMILAVINAICGNLTKEQINNIFKKILVSANKIPAIRYNMGMYYMQQLDKEAAISCFNQHREQTHSAKAEPLIAQQCFSISDFKRTLKTVKKNVLHDPANHSHRAQLWMTTHCKCDEDKRLNSKRLMEQNLQQIKMCMRFYRFYADYNTNTLKEPILKQIAAKIKQVCIDMSVQGQKLVKEYEKKLKGLLQIENGGEDEREDEDERRKREMQEKRKKALALSKVKNQTVSESWSIISEKQKAAEGQKAQKTKRKSNRDTSDDPSPRRKPNPRQKREELTRSEAEEYYSVSNRREKEKKGKLELVRQEARGQDDYLSKYLVE